MLTDGSRVLLLGTDCRPAEDVLAFRAVLFDGGREADVAEGYGSASSPDTQATGCLHGLLRRAREERWPVFTYGRGWRWVLESVMTCVGDLELLPLCALAAGLAGVPRTATPAVLLEALGAPAAAYVEGTFSDLYEDLLWAVIHAASEAGLGGADLSGLLEAASPDVSFDTYGFDQQTLAGLPDCPGVYIMRDARGRVLYVGKAASLCRRLQDYFRAQADVPRKLEAIRSRIKTFNCYLVGSELEALLLEHRLIGELEPEINVQRALSQDSGRCGSVPEPIAIIAPSVADNRRVVFMFGSRRCVQIRTVPTRPPRSLLTRLAAYVRGEATTLPHHAHLQDWGPDGCTICTRHWFRRRNSVTWLALGGATREAAEAVVQALAATAETTEPAELRWRGE